MTENDIEEYPLTLAVGQATGLQFNLQGRELIRVKIVGTITGTSLVPTEDYEQNPLITMAAAALTIPVASNTSTVIPTGTFPRARMLKLTPNATQTGAACTVICIARWSSC